MKSDEINLKKRTLLGICGDKLEKKLNIADEQCVIN